MNNVCQTGEKTIFYYTFHLRNNRLILSITWKDRVSNAEVLFRAGRPSMYTLLRRAYCADWAMKQTGDEAIVTELLPPGYTFHHVARSRGRGGRVAVVYRNTYNTKILPKLHFTTIELIRLQFTNPFLLKYNLWVIYHPPATSKTSGTLSDFY